MRYGIFSDIHANLEAFRAVIKVYATESIDEFLCLGDIVGYAANPCECLQEVRTLTKINIAGNHDWAGADLFSVDYFNPLAKEAILWTSSLLSNSEKRFLKSLPLVFQNQVLTLVHGSLDAPGDFNYLVDAYAARQTFKFLKTQICFVGHSHVAGIFLFDTQGFISYREENRLTLKAGYKYIVNVGSIGQPRDDDPAAAYCIYDTDKKTVEIKRISYDILTARKKIISAGLPRFLADRLLSGR
jgi:predicted phosphodiesterase